MQQDLIILDELGFVPFFNKALRCYLVSSSQRYLRGSLLLTTNLPFADWTDIFRSAGWLAPLPQPPHPPLSRGRVRRRQFPLSPEPVLDENLQQVPGDGVGAG